MKKVAMAGGDGVLEAPRRTLDVQRFAKARSSELLPLHGALKLRRARPHDQAPTEPLYRTIRAALPRHLRRRTSSYSRRRRLPGLYNHGKKRKPAASPVSLPPKQRKLDPDIATSGAASSSNTLQGSSKKRLCRRLRRKLEFKAGSCLISSDGTRRLATHVWHAKRFSMTKCWGYYLPLGRPGRGHGSRAVLRWSKDAALLQDASFYSAIQIQGCQEQISRVMQLMLESPSTDPLCEAAQSVLSGECFGTAVLHHIGEASYKIIAPVLLAWRPVLPDPGTLACEAGPSEGSIEKDLLLWVHAAAFDEAFQALQAVCCKLSEESGGASVHCFSRRGDLGRIDILGTKSFEVLQKVIFPVCRNQQGNCIKLWVLPQPNELPGKCIVNMEVFDPRQKPNERCLFAPSCHQSDSETQGHKLLNSQEMKSSKTQEPETKDGDVQIGQEVDSGGIMVDESEESAFKFQGINPLWDSSGGQLRPPVSEKCLSKMRHTNRLTSYGFLKDGVNNGNMSGKRKGLSGKYICPVMLLKHDSQNPSSCGWSIILPLSWVSAFWVPLVFAGGHVIGLREHHWLITEAGLPSFPDDFPDSLAYADSWIADSEGHVKALSRRPQNRGSIPLSGVALVSESGHKDIGIIELQSIVSRSAAGERDELHANVSAKFVARSAACLATFLQKSYETALLLFPAKIEMTEKLKTFYQRFQEGTIAWHTQLQTLAKGCVPQTEYNCLLRVSLRPFRKGVMDVGATVYAPTPEDYNFWSLMRDDHKKQLMNSASEGHTISSEYFCLRKPIGFVTSAPPRGSKNSASIAFCEAVILGQVRARQWLESKWQNDQIFLMARNNGSDTCRPAFASICLEEGPDIF